MDIEEMKKELSGAAVDGVAFTQGVQNSIRRVLQRSDIRVAVTFQDTLHTFIRIHPEEEFVLDRGLVGRAIRRGVRVVQDEGNQVRPALMSLIWLEITYSCLK